MSFLLRRALPLAVVALLMPVGSLLADHHEASTVDPSGTWRWEHDEEGQLVKNVLILNFDGKKKVTGTYQNVGDEEWLEITDGELEGDELSFHLIFEADVQGQDLEIEIFFAGQVDGDEIDGSVEMAIEEFDFNEEFMWRAKRWLEPVDVVGKWQFEIKLPDGNVLEPQFEFSLAEGEEKLQGTHTASPGLNSKLEVTDIGIKDKERLTFTVSGDFHGGELTATYSLLPRGDRLQGRVEYDLEGDVGELEVSGSREREKTAADDKDA